MVSAGNGQNSAGAGGATLCTGKNKGADLSLIHKAICGGWLIPQELMAELPEMALKIARATEEGTRERLRAMEILRAMQRDNVEAAVLLARFEADAGVTRTKIVIEYEHREARDV